jgi:hypothetical protein
MKQIKTPALPELILWYLQFERNLLNFIFPTEVLTTKFSTFTHFKNYSPICLFIYVLAFVGGGQVLSM